MPVARSLLASGQFGGPGSQFPLSVSGRHLIDRFGRPFLLHGDTAWSIVGQLTDAEITQYLNNRQAKGFNAILFSAPEAYYTSQTPAYRNASGQDPFTSMSPVAWQSPNEAYWARVDHLVNGARARGMVCIINPAYLGYASGQDGWYDAIDAASAGNLQTYGAWLANRYAQGNVIWSLGGDNDTSGIITKQANILTGIRSVRTTDIVTAHPLSNSGDNDDAWTYWSGITGVNLNWIYGYENGNPNAYVYELAAQAYGRSGPVAFLGAEFKYEGSSGATDAMIRRQSYGAILAGACGQIYGNWPIWGFESSRWPESFSGSWEDALDTAAAQQQVYVRLLFSAYEWWKLEPKTDTSLVASSLSTNATRLYPALASDGSFAMIYVPSGQTIEVNTNALVGVAGNVRIRRWNVTSGDWATINASVAKTAAQSVATGSEGVIVVDRAP